MQNVMLKNNIKKIYHRFLRLRTRESHKCSFKYLVEPKFAKNKIKELIVTSSIIENAIFSK